ncbi:MAG: acyl-CoA dehydrogenase C-terminal domain-containing protein [Sinobacteraceae bacterium]|nr:acyl-CoA dehydrogenase C-terminal domain-containing protein [Nevskiaceae bacterium]
MASYTTPRREFAFVLRDVLNVDRLAALPGFEDAAFDLYEGVIDEAGKLIEEQLLPLRASGDQQGCTLEDGEVAMPDGFAQAYKMYQQAGWVGLANPTEYSGQGLPYTLAKVVEEIMYAANVGFSLTPMLTTGCFEAILASASDDIKNTYLPKLGDGSWAGAMCLTEPQAGTDLAAIRTRATPNDDGSYSIEGSKIFITSGEHQMTDNIIHFVLARLPDAPPGVRGLSTFVVPKFLVNQDGSLGERNNYKTVSLEEKMGIHGSCTCAMQFEGATGYLSGAPHTGIRNMFVMMNLERIMVGLQGLGQCELALQNALEYARERKQGKAFNGGDTIIHHPDVRRTLMTMKAITEGARVLGYETTINVDLAHNAKDEAQREAANDWVELNTPLVKAFCTDSAVELGSMAIQVYGGHGFIRESGVEQIVRDSKILCLYEGTNGVQSMDLVRRKLGLHGGRLPKRFFDAVRAEQADAEFDFIAKPLQTAVDDLEATTEWLQKSMQDNPNDAGFGCTAYLRAFALTYLGWNWLRMAKAANQLKDGEFKTGKLTTARFFATHLLPEAASLCQRVRQPASEYMECPAEAL